MLFNNKRKDKEILSNKKDTNYFSCITFYQDMLFNYLEHLSQNKIINPICEICVFISVISGKRYYA